MTHATFAPIRSTFLAASVLAAALVLSIGAQAKDVATTTPAASTATAKAELATPAVKRARKTVRRSTMRQIAAVEAPRAPQCFLFWCGRPAATPWLVLGVAY